MDACLADRLSGLRALLTRRAQAIVGNPADAEDAVQEAAARAWAHRRTLRPGSDPAPWIATIVTRVAINLARQKARRSALPPGDSAAPRESVEENVIRGELRRAIDAAAAALPPASRRVFVLHDVEGLSSYDIAALDDVPYHTVRTRLRRARISLRSELHEAV